MIISGNTITINGSTVTEDNIKSVAAGFYTNPTTISASYEIPTGSNAVSAGPITVADGATITVPDGSTWTVV